MSEKHTPTPWTADESLYAGWRFAGGFNGAIVGADGRAVYAGPSSFYSLCGGSEDEARANAHFIVHACNAHDDLLEACRWFVHLAHDVGRSGETPEPDELLAATTAGMAAIAKAEGREP